MKGCSNRRSCVVCTLARSLLWRLLGFFLKNFVKNIGILSLRVWCCSRDFRWGSFNWKSCVEDLWFCYKSLLQITMLARISNPRHKFYISKLCHCPQTSYLILAYCHTHNLNTPNFLYCIYLLFAQNTMVKLHPKLDLTVTESSPCFTETVLPLFARLGAHPEPSHVEEALTQYYTIHDLIDD